MLSPRSAANPNCAGEYWHLLNQKKCLYVALLETVSPAQIPWRLGIIQAVDLRENFEGGVEALANAILGKREIRRGDAIITTAKRITGLSDSKLLAIPMSGRDSDVSKVLGYLRQHPTTIEGIGGLGKSRLAAAVVMSDEVPGAVWLVADEYTRADDVLASLRDHFDMEADTDRRDILTKVRAYPLLMVIDNAESVPDRERPEIIRLLRELRAAGAWVLLTSRKAWTGLSPDRRHMPTALTLETAARVALDMAEVYGIPYDLGDKAEALAGAARLHPRLIELGIIQIARGSSPEAAIRELDALRSDDTQTMLDEMLLVNVRQMVERDDPDGEAILRQLNVFRGGFTEEAAKAVLGLSDEDFDRHIRALVSWQFVKRRIDEHNRTRYEAEPLVIEVVGEDSSLYPAHYDYYKRLARLHDERQEYWSLEVEASNLEAAFERMMSVNNVASASGLANAVIDFMHNRGRFLQQFDWMSRVDSMLDEGSDEELIGAVKNGLGNAYRGLAVVEERTVNLHRAIAAHTEALRYYTPASAPLAYAGTQNNLGNAYNDLAAVEEREGNLRRAIDAFTEALRFYTPASAPLDYAMTQNNLGLAYSNLAGIEEREGNLHRAIAAYTEALRYRTPASAPLDYAMMQNNLGNAYYYLAGVEEREGNLRRAIDAYMEALRCRTPDNTPLDYAGTQQNLGTAYRELASVEDGAANLRRAIAAYTEALRFYTPVSAPLDYATTQNNLGTAYSDLALIEERAVNLCRAIDAYREALRFYTPASVPLDYARTQTNLGITYAELSEIQTAILCWGEAEKYFRQMGDVEKANRMLKWIEAAKDAE